MAEAEFMKEEAVVDEPSVEPSVEMVAAIEEAPKATEPEAAPAPKAPELEAAPAPAPAPAPSLAPTFVRRGGGARLSNDDLAGRSDGFKASTSASLAAIRSDTALRCGALSVEREPRRSSMAARSICRAAARAAAAARATPEETAAEAKIPARLCAARREARPAARRQTTPFKVQVQGQEAEAEAAAAEEEEA